MRGIGTLLVGVPVILFALIPSTASAQGTPAAAAAPATTSVNPMIPRLADIPGVGDPMIVDKLRKGGYIIFFRHAATDWGQQDVMGQDFENRAAQRNLSDVGKAQAVSIGQAFKALALPVDSVFASPMWRCRDTADIAFGHCQPMIELFGKGPVVKDGKVTAPTEMATYRDMRLKILSTAPVAGSNRILVGHQDPMIPIIPGLHRDELREGDALVIDPQGHNKFKVVFLITSADWSRLAAAYPASKMGSSEKAASAMDSSK
jgi:phosphohistidine phosphatase SixA